MITVDVQPAGLYYNLHDLIRMAYPGDRVQPGLASGTAGHISICVTERNHQILFAGSICIGVNSTQANQAFEADTADDRPLKMLTRNFTYRLLCQHLGKNFNLYGTLTGVRPVKLVHRWLDQSRDEDIIKAQLERDYLISPEKADLLVAVARANRSFLPVHNQVHKGIGIYIGIPFCPSRCYYCSFPGAILHDYEREVRPFTDALLTEMNTIGDYIRQRGWAVETIYIGGGTPTVLSDGDLQLIFRVLQQKYISDRTVEITVEAGRPDTLTLQRLRLLQQAGTTRVCINPQTMNDDTLHRIGRRHNRHMVEDAMEWARWAGIPQVNMDMIVGLPAETREDFRATAEKILELKPDNITVHTLAVKRGSDMLAMEGRGTSPAQAMLVEQGVGDCQQIFREHGFHPYYLYRQKYMLASLENIGYTLAGNQCLYNIQMIEERQTIIGLGAGASSKLVNWADGSLVTLHNPKDPVSYSKSLPGLIARQVDKLEALN